MRANAGWAALVTGMLLAGLTGCGGGNEIPDGWTTKDKVKKQLVKERQKVSLPKGWHWQDQVAGGQKDIYEEGAAQAMVLDEVTCAWSLAALKSAEKDDERGQEKALAELKELRNLPAYKRNDVSYRQLVESTQSKAELGDFSTMSQYVDNNCKSYS
ncbi:hypothetical protein [Streptomyces sp. KR80]|uniref:hypothetical protein n=1 Tax=Streptomyces sp. KR80 TaxID=3457426 RepID=UPI003FD0EFC3